MANPTIDRILRDLGQPHLVDELISRLSPSDLNSLLLEINRRMSEQITPGRLMDAYRKNRFVVPSAISGLQFAKADVQILAWAQQHFFETIELSPLAPLGNCSAIALADQNKIVSAVRNTEVVADATNLLALEAASRRKKKMSDTAFINLCTVHRQVRAQTIPDVPHFTPHFKLFCAVTAGRDTGSFQFEKSALVQHLAFYADYFTQAIELDNVKVTIKGLTEPGVNNRLAPAVYAHLKENLEGIDMAYVELPASEHRYYHGLRFSIDLIIGETVMNLGDGGLVDWGAKLTSNNKDRMLTSGLGLELLLKLNDDRNRG